MQVLRGKAAAQGGASLAEMAWAWAGSAAAMLALAALEKALQQNWNFPLLMGSFGASAVLLFGTPQSPLAQPRNVIGGHVLSALVGVAAFQLLGADALAAGGAVSTALVLMFATKTLHPPGGATALMAVIGGEGIHDLGYAYVLLPCGVGAVLMVLMALVIHTVSRQQRYPLGRG